jgi:hypothetical protein
LNESESHGQWIHRLENDLKPLTRTQWVFIV